jgi:hypothetical protein
MRGHGTERGSLDERREQERTPHQNESLLDVAHEEKLVETEQHLHGFLRSPGSAPSTKREGPSSQKQVNRALLENEAFLHRRLANALAESVAEDE